MLNKTVPLLRNEHAGTPLGTRKSTFLSALDGMKMCHHTGSNDISQQKPTHTHTHSHTDTHEFSCCAGKTKPPPSVVPVMVLLNQLAAMESVRAALPACGVLYSTFCTKCASTVERLDDMFRFGVERNGTGLVGGNPLSCLANE